MLSAFVHSVAKLEVEAHRTGQPFDHRAMLLCLWALHPFATVSCAREEFKFLLALARHSRVRLWDVVAANRATVSHLALFLASPHSLSTVRMPTGLSV